jgi:transposase
VGKASGSGGVSRGDRRRNARRERLRGLVPRGGAVVGIDLGDDRQALAVIDHDVRVLARRVVRVRVHRLGEAVDWAVARARAAGFSEVTVACEPAGARWMQVQRLCEERGLALVCIQPLVSHIAREQQDYTPHKTDEADCVLIARLAAELHCYVPEELDETWAHLRHLGRRRAQLVTAATASVLRVRDFLSVAWPAVTGACARPFASVTWQAAVQVVTSRCGGVPEQLAAAGPEAFAALVVPGVAGRGGKRADARVLRAVFAALTCTQDAVTRSRRGLFRRVADELGDLARTRAQLRAVEADMVTVLAELGLARLGDIPGLTALGAAVILAETGDPRRYDCSSSLVKHAGLSPADHASGAFEGQARISRRGRPGLRLAAWRAVTPLILHNPVMTAKYQAMTAAAVAAAAAGPRSRPASAAERAARARRARARVACAAALLRWIYAIVTHGTSWDPAEAAAASRRPPDGAPHPARRRRAPQTTPVTPQGEPA